MNLSLFNFATMTTGYMQKEEMHQNRFIEHSLPLIWFRFYFPPNSEETTCTCKSHAKIAFVLALALLLFEVREINNTQYPKLEP